MPNPYLRLMRLHQPTGIWLLLWPCWWALALASPNMPSLRLLTLFALGAVVMRAAGCIINDIADRDIDRRVVRTQSRPIASGEITVWQAGIVLFVLLFIALVIAVQMNQVVLVYAALSLGLVALYPFMKRITWWPQAFLGVTFNWGAILGWVAVRGELSLPAIALYIGSVFWTLGYDTIYAHQDASDDAKVGVKSTALKLGAQSKKWIAGFYTLALLGWGAAGFIAGNSMVYFAGLLCAGVHFFCQVKYVNLNAPQSCMKIFRSNTVVGWIVFVSLLLRTLI